jgi:hypothetical protein
MRCRWLLLAACCCALPFAAAAEEAPPALPGLSITLAPGGVGDDGNPAWIDVATRISGRSWAADEAFLRIPAKFAGVPGVPYETADLAVNDDRGPVPLSASIDDPDEGGFIYFRRWAVGRATEGDITLNYRAPIELMIPKLGAGPPFDLRAAGGGFSGAGNTFIVMPDTAQPFLIGIAWDLAALAPGSTAVSSFGVGDTTAPGPVDRLIASYFMAGPIGRHPEPPGDAKFSGFWIGSPRFDARDLLQWSERAYGAVAAFFGESDPPAFRVLMRGNPYPGGGGAALMSSFLVSYPDTLENGHKLRETIAHETVHNWVTSLSGPPGSTTWFSEGMTVAYTRWLLLGSGLFTPDEFLESVNDTALSYYTNALNTVPNGEIAGGFWSDTRIRSLPYARGSLYFASVDAAIREHSGGNRSLDDLLKAFVVRREAGEEVTGETWRELITAELGPPGGEALDAMLGGELVIPPGNAFGRCFVRGEQQVRRFDLGFDRASLFEEPRTVTGLVAGSEAERAGIREGDRIRQPVPLEEAQSDPQKTVTLQMIRGDTEFEATYLPRGQAVRAYLWRRNENVPDSACSGRAD